MFVYMYVHAPACGLRLICNKALFCSVNEYDRMHGVLCLFREKEAEGEQGMMEEVGSNFVL